MQDSTMSMLALAGARLSWELMRDCLQVHETRVQSSSRGIGRAGRSVRMRCVRDLHLRSTWSGESGADVANEFVFRICLSAQTVLTRETSKKHAADAARRMLCNSSATRSTCLMCSGLGGKISSFTEVSSSDIIRCMRFVQIDLVQAQHTGQNSKKPPI